MTDPISGELLFRNVPKGHFDPSASEPTAAAVWPTDRDQGLLSTDRDSIWTAIESYTSRTKALGLDSRGIIALDSDELVAGWGIETTPDPLVKGVADSPVDNPAHALSDFNHLTDAPPGERKKARERILQKVLARGWVHGPFVD